MTGQPDSNDSLDPLDAAVAEYLQQAEAGTRPDRDAVLVAHPDLAERLRAFFADLDRMGSRGESFRLPVVALPGDFGDYEFLGEIGRGGMGVVYRVRQKSLDRVVALKMILGGWATDPATLERFRTEAGTLSRLDHPHIVPILDVGEHLGHPYFTMKLIAGQSLSICFDRYLSDPRSAAELLAKVCLAIDHAHQRGILHRDLKPGNILVDAGGEPHVTDFGLARRIEEGRGHTRSGTVVGTPEYMAPEQAAGAQDVTVAIDVYGLGAVLYTLLAGSPPFRAETAIATLRRVADEPPVSPRKVRPGVPRDLETICLKCLEKCPAKRYATVAELAADLGRCLRGEPIAARRVGPLERFGKWARRRPAAAALLLVSLTSLVLVAGGGSLLNWKLSTANEQLADANRDLGVKSHKLEGAMGDLGTANARLEDALWLSRREVYNLQLARVAAVFERDPGPALDLLYDTDACPIDLRDAAWRYYETAARRYHQGDRPGVIVARGPKMEAGNNFCLEEPHQPHQGHLWAVLRAGAGASDSSYGLDSKRAAVEMAKYSLQVVDLLSGDVKATLPASVNSRMLNTGRIVISLDGGMIVWVESDSDQTKHRVVAYDVIKGELLDPKVVLVSQEPTSTYRPWYLVVSPDGKGIVLREVGDARGRKPARIIELATGKVLHEFRVQDSPDQRLAFSPDGKHLIYESAVGDKPALRVIDLGTFQLSQPFAAGFFWEEHKAHRAPPLFAPDGRHVLNWEVNPNVDVRFGGQPARRLVVYEFGEAPTPRVHYDLPTPYGELKFSPDGRYAALAEEDGVIRVLETRSWTVKQTLTVRTRALGASRGREGVNVEGVGIVFLPSWNLAFSHDGRELVVSDAVGIADVRRECALYSFNVETGDRRPLRHGDFGVFLGLSDRNELRSTLNRYTDGGEPLYSWKLSPQSIGRSITTNGRVSAVRFAQDARSLFYTATIRRRASDDSIYDKPVRAVGGEVTLNDKSHRTGYRVNDGDVVYDDDTIFRLDLTTGKTTQHKSRPPDYPPDDAPRGRLVDPRGSEWTFAVEPDPRWHSARTAWLTNRRTRETRKLPIDVPVGTETLGPTPDGQCLLFGRADGSVELRDAWTGRARATLVGHAFPVYGAVWAAGGMALATLAKDGSIRVWDLGPPAALGRWPGGPMAFAADGHSVFDSDDLELRIRSLHTGRAEPLLSPPNRGLPPTRGSVRLLRLGVTADGRHLTGTGLAGLFVVSLGDRALLPVGFGDRDQDGVAATTYQTTVAPDGRFAVGLRREVRGFFPNPSHVTEEPVRLDLPEGKVRTLARFPPGRDRRDFEMSRLFVTSDSREVVYTRDDRSGRGGLIWEWYDATTGSLLREAHSPGVCEGSPVTTPLLSPDGRTAVVQEPWQSIVWDLRAGKEKWRLPLRGYVYSTAAFSCDGRWLAAGDAAGNVLMWDAETGRELRVLDTRAVLTGTLAPRIRELCFDPTGRRVAARVSCTNPVESLQEQVVVWDFDPEAAARLGQPAVAGGVR